jgi:hypothetical protein
MMRASNWAEQGPARRLRSVWRDLPWSFALRIAAAGYLSFVAQRPGVAATFGPLSGLLSARAGTNPTKFSGVAYGSQSLSDQSFSPTFSLASSSLSATITGTRLFDFAAVASSSTNMTAPSGLNNAVATATFGQTFTTAAPQWIQVTARVGAPADPDVSTLFSFSRVGQPPLFQPGDTGGGERTYNALLPAGSYRVEGSVDTQATVPPAHSGVIAGFALVAALADFNASGAVNGGDLPTIRNNFGVGTTFATGDVDGNGLTDGFDVLLWQRQLGTTILPGVGTVPEPASYGILLCGFALIATMLRSSSKARI